MLTKTIIYQMIKLQIIGYLGRNAVEKQVNGRAVLNFNVAHNERYKDAQGVLQERTIWAECAMWAPNGVGPYLLQGTYVFVEGTPHLELYTTSAGTPATSLKLRVTGLKLLSGGGRSAAEEKATVPDVPQPEEELQFE